MFFGGNRDNNNPLGFIGVARDGDPRAACRHAGADGDQPHARICGRPRGAADLRRAALACLGAAARSTRAAHADPERDGRAQSGDRASCSSSIRSRASAWTTCSRPIRRPRTASPRSMQLAPRWAAARAERRAEQRTCSGPGARRRPAVHGAGAVPQLAARIFEAGMYTFELTRLRATSGSTVPSLPCSTFPPHAPSPSFHESRSARPRGSARAAIFSRCPAPSIAAREQLEDRQSMLGFGRSPARPRTGSPYRRDGAAASSERFAIFSARCLDRGAARPKLRASSLR